MLVGNLVVCLDVEHARRLKAKYNVNEEITGNGMGVQREEGGRRSVASVGGCLAGLPAGRGGRMAASVGSLKNEIERYLAISKNVAAGWMM